jgi:type II secretory pathway predicted ATPase ExeA
VYKRFYGLQKNPFEITPDPSFLFTTKGHNEALATLYYGVRRRKGFVVLTGEVGTGKTLLIRSLLQLLKLGDVHYAYVFNPRLGPVEFLQYIAGDFRLPISSKTKSELLLELSSFVISRYKKGLTTVLVADEAHHLSEEVLEEIRLLTNLETSEEKLLQILLVGQPELDEKLDSVSLRQLKQRIALRSRLAPLQLEETEGYIRRRLQVAGSANPDALFPFDTVLEIHRHSRGIPRLINTLCENSLVYGYARQSAKIAPEMIEEIALDFRLNIVHSTPEAEADRQSLKTVEQAAKTLLDLYASLRQAQSSGGELKAAVRDIGAKNESYI